MSTLLDVLRTATRSLQQASLDSADLDARLLLCSVLNLSRLDLLTQKERPLTTAEESAYAALIARRLAHEPVGRLLGTRSFWGLSFGLNEATLEPRPDSETLIEAAQKKGTPPPAVLWDLGTGTGCLLLALLTVFPSARGIGFDKAPRALEQARANAQALGLTARATFIESDWLSHATGRADLIVSNPPYIKASDIETLQPEVRLFDPRLALDGGQDGLDPYRHLAPRLSSYLTPNGHVLFEVGEGQAEDVATLLKEAAFTDITFYKDLGGIKRVVAARKAASTTAPASA